MIPTFEFQIRFAKPGDEPAIHDAHMRSIREICVKDHGTEEIKGWGHRELGDRWTKEIQNGTVWVVERNGCIHGVGYIRFYVSDESIKLGYIHALYLTPEAHGRGLGLRLLEILVDRAKLERAKAVKLESSITAHNFYLKFGFKDSGSMQTLDVGGYPVTAFPMRYELELPS